MNVYAVLQGSTLLAYLFILGLVFGRARQDPVNRAFRLFLLFAIGWSLTAFVAFLPESAGHEMLLKRAGAACWLALTFWFVHFAYLATGRHRDPAYWLTASIIALGAVIYLLTDLAIAGFVRYDWGIAATRGPLHSAVALIPAFADGYGLFVIARAIPHARNFRTRRSLGLIVVGGVAALAFATLSSAILPVVVSTRGFPELGTLGIFILCPFVYLAVTRHDFLSVTVFDAAQHLTEDMADGVVLADRSGVVVQMNPAARRMLGRLPASDDRIELSRLLPDHASDADASESEFVLRHGGEERFISMVQSRSAPPGTQLGKVVVLRDVTAEKHTEELLRRSRDELQAEVVRRTEELRHAQKMEAIGTLAGGIAHDFNNILAAIVGYTTAVKEELTADHVLQPDLKEVLRAAGRARDIVRQLLSFSRRKESNKKTVDLRSVVAESIKLLEASLPATIQVDFVPARKSCAVVADPTQLQQVVLNLATNAFHAMEDKGGVLRVSLARVPVDAVFAEQHPPLKAGPHICLAVSDSGCGMTPDVLARIFDTFFTTKSAERGTGLGLTTTLRIVQEHGGAITVESEPLIGSTFRVYLPVAEFDLLADSTKDQTMPRGTESLMIVDDKEPVAASTVRLLQPLGYRTTIFTDPDLAIAAVAETPRRFDLIITDQTMPRVTGVMLADPVARIRADLPVLLVSGYPAPAGINAGTPGPVRAFLSKPVDKAQLARTIRKLIDESGSSGAASSRRTDPSIAGTTTQRPS